MTKKNDPTIRHFIDVLNEDVATDIMNKIKAFGGDAEAIGKEDAKKLYKNFDERFTKWVARTNNEKNVKSIAKFMVSVIGFTPKNTQLILGKAGIADMLTSDRVVEPAELESAFVSAAGFAFENDLVDTGEASATKKQNQGGGSSSGDNFGSGSRRSGSGPSSAERDLRRAANPGNGTGAGGRAIYNKEVKAAGLDEEDIANLAATVNGDDVKKYSEFFSASDRGTINQLAIIGYAYLKSQK